MSISDKLRTYAEMAAADEFIQYLELLKSGSLADASGINRALERLSCSIDALLDAFQATKNMFITRGGSLSWDSATTELAWSSELRLYFSHELGTASYNRISANHVHLSDGEVAYVKIDRTSNALITANKAASMAGFITLITGDTSRLDYQILAYREGADILLWDGRRLRTGFSLSNNGCTDTQYGQQGELTTVHNNEIKNLGMFLSGGGDITWDLSTHILTWDDDLFIELPGEAAPCTVLANNVSLLAHQAMYVTLVRDPAGPGAEILAFFTADIDSVPQADNTYVLCIRGDDDRIYWRDGTSQSDGETVLLGGVRSGLQWYYGEVGDGTQVTDFSVDNEYHIGEHDLIVMRNGVKAANRSGAYWNGAYPAGSLVGTIDPAEMDEYLEEQNPSGSGRGHRIIWIQDGQVAGEPVYYPALTHSPEWVWPTSDEWVEAFVGLQGEGPSPVESIGISGDPGDPLEGQVLLLAGTNITITYDTGKIKIAASITAGVASIEVAGGHHGAQTGALQVLGEDGVQASDDTGKVVLSSIEALVAYDLLDFHGNPEIISVHGFDVIKIDRTKVYLGPGLVTYDYENYGSDTVTEVSGISDWMAGEGYSTAGWYYVYVGEKTGIFFSGLSDEAPNAGGRHPTDVSLRCVASFYATGGSTFYRATKRGCFVAMDNAPNIASSLAIDTHDINTLDLTNYLPETGVTSVKIAMTIEEPVGAPYAYGVISVRGEYASSSQEIYYPYSNGAYHTLIFEVVLDSSNQITIDFSAAHMEDVTSFKIIGYTEGVYSIGSAWS